MNANDLNLLFICSIRYCLGRHTYMPSTIQEIVKSNAENLDKNTIEVMLRDVTEYLEGTNPFTWNGVKDIDYDGWEEFKKWLESVPLS